MGASREPDVRRRLLLHLVERSALALGVLDAWRALIRDVGVGADVDGGHVFLGHVRNPDDVRGQASCTTSVVRTVLVVCDRRRPMTGMSPRNGKVSLILCLSVRKQTRQEVRLAVLEADVRRERACADHGLALPADVAGSPSCETSS